MSPPPVRVLNTQTAVLEQENISFVRPRDLPKIWGQKGKSRSSLLGLSSLSDVEELLISIAKSSMYDKNETAIVAVVSFVRTISWDIRIG